MSALAPARAERAWLPVPRPAPDARLRLFCFPYAGGSASAWALWFDRLPPTVEFRPIQLPGRGNRIRERPIARFDDLIEALAPLLLPLLDRPFAIFGHSMGALLAFEAVRRIRRQGGPPPVHLFVSGRRAPHLADPELAIAEASDADFLAHIRDLAGTPPEILDNPGLMDLFLPALRADFRVCHSYRYRDEPPIECPITAFGGDQDVESAGDRLARWQEHTRARCSVQMFPGDHWYLHACAPPLVRSLRQALAEVLVNPRP